MPRKPKVVNYKGVYEKVKGSGIWWIRYTKDGKRITESIGSQSDAITMFQQRMTELRAGIKISVRTGRRGIKFKEIAEDALRYSKDNHIDSKNFKQRLDVATGEFGLRVADSITPQELGGWLSEMMDEQEWSPGTRNRYKAAVSKTYALGMANLKVHTNPARFVPQKKENPGRIRFVTEDEEARLRAVIEDKRPHCMYQLDIGLHTGMRRSEQFSVTWDQVDFKNRLIYLNRTKNGSDRYVHLNQTAIDSLTKLQAYCREKELKFNTLFYDRRHMPIKDPQAWFEVACEEAKVVGVTWHILRHTFASRLVMAGVDLKTVQELMGHKTIAMTARYSHLSPGHLKSAINKLDAAPKKPAKSVAKKPIERAA